VILKIMLKLTASTLRARPIPITNHLNRFIPANPKKIAIMNAIIRASNALIHRFFPNGVLNRNDKTTMKTVEPMKKGDSFKDWIAAVGSIS